MKSLNGVKKRNADVRYLWLAVWRILRRNLDGVVAPQGITVLHVCITFAAHAGASILHIRTCLKDTHAFMLCPQLWPPDLFSVVVTEKQLDKCNLCT